MAIDKFGNFYFVDTKNNVINMISNKDLNNMNYTWKRKY